MTRSLRRRDPSLRTRRGIRTAAAVGTALLTLTVVACGDETTRPSIDAADDDVAADHEFHVPAGTGERIDAGQEVELVPQVLEVRVGDVLRIVNDDERGHTVGAFYVGPGETLTQTFTSPGELSGACTIHPSGEFVLIVEA